MLVVALGSLNLCVALRLPLPNALLHLLLLHERPLFASLAGLVAFQHGLKLAFHRLLGQLGQNLAALGIALLSAHALHVLVDGSQPLLLRKLGLFLELGGHGRLLCVLKKILFTKM